MFGTLFMPRVVVVQGAERVQVSEESVPPQLNNEEEIKRYIRRVFSKEQIRAVTVAGCESGYRTGVISRTGDIGIFQINLAAHGAEIAPTRQEQIWWLQDPKNNIDFAYSLYKKNGWQDWYMSRFCWDKL